MTANVVVGVENVPPANLVIPAAPPAGNGRPRRTGLSVCNYNENNHELELEIGAESPIGRKSGSKRRRQLCLIMTNAYSQLLILTST